MMKAMYSGVAGLRAHQTKMDVIGNNIANVNTYSYKSQRVTFRDVYYQTLRSPSESTTGGTNPSQVGYGSQVGSIDTIHTRSGYSPTDRPLDIYINGEGFLAVQDLDGSRKYTRLGALSFDGEGNLVDLNGLQILVADGTNTDGTVDGVETLKIDDIGSYTNINIGPDGSITGVKDGKVESLGNLCIANIPNSEALVLDGNSYYSAVSNEGEIAFKVPGKGGTGTLITGGLEMSNVDLAREFTDMITTQRGYQANSRIITVVDEMLQELVNLKR